MVRGKYNKKRLPKKSFFNGGLSGMNLTLWGFLKNPRTFEIQSGQEKRALEGSFSKNGGR